MTLTDRTRRQQLLREAEGYLDLATVFSETWGLSPKLRNRLAKRALRLLGEAKEMGEPTFEAIYLEGEALRTLQRFSDALVPLENARQIDDKNIHVHLALAWCYKRVGRLDRAIEILEEGLSVDPTEAILYYNLACYWSLAENTRLAVRYLSEAFDIEPSYRDLVAKEKDFDPIRKDPAFLAVTSVIV